MAYSRIEQAYVDGLVQVQFPDPVEQEPTLLANANTGAPITSDAPTGSVTVQGFTEPKQVRVGRAGVPFKGPSMSDITTPAMGMLDMGAATVKGATQGFIGLPGDLEGLGRLALNYMGVNVDEATALPTTEEVRKFFDAKLGPVGNGKNPYESIGEIVAPGGQIKAIKPVAKAIKGAVKMTEGLPVGLSTQSVGKGMDDLGFYSAARQAVDAIQQPKGTGEQFLAQISKTPGVKPDEIKWTGLDDFLTSKKSVTKQEVQDYMASNRVEIKEVKLAEPKNEWQGNFLMMDRTAVAKIEENAEGMYVLRDTMTNKVTPLDAIQLDQAVKKAEKLYGVTGEVTPFDGKPKYDKYTLPGGENYREILLTLPSNMGEYNKFSDSLRAKYGDGGFDNLPLTDIERSRLNKFYADEEKQPFKSNHFDQPNVLAHLRVNDRVDADGKKVLMVEEVQSDWHQSGRKKGYNTPEVRQRLLDERKKLLDQKDYYAKLAEPYAVQGKDSPTEIVDGWTMAANRLQELQTIENRMGNAVPDAPFKGNWHELAMKRAIQLAAEGGYERIAFTTGKTQAARFDLSKEINYLELNKNTTGNGKPFTLRAFKENSNQGTLLNQAVDESELEDLIGKDLSKKLIEQTPTEYGDRALSGVDLQVGGEGMSGFYDNILPKFLDKYAKKWDAKTGMTSIEVGKGKPTNYANFSEYEKAPNKSNEPVHYIDITPKMRESVVTKGQPMFSIGAGGAGVGAAATQQDQEN